MTGLYGDFLADMPSAPSCAESCLTELIDAVQQLRRVQRFHSHQRWCSPVAELLTAGQEGPGIPTPPDLQLWDKKGKSRRGGWRALPEECYGPSSSAAVRAASDILDCGLSASHNTAYLNCTIWILLNRQEIH